MKTARSLRMILLVFGLAETTRAKEETIVSNTVPMLAEIPVAIRAPAARKAALPVTTDTQSASSSNVISVDLGIGASRLVRPEIRLLEDGAVADYGLQKVFFPAEIAEAPITIITPDGRKLACRAAFLALHDDASGQSLLLGEVRQSIGELIGDNTVLYPNAFDTIRADIRYRYARYFLEQDIILHEAISIPKSFRSENVQLEVWSEWIDSTPDTRESQTIDLRPLAAAGKAAAVAATDEYLKFGAMRIGDGYAFGIQSVGERTPVAKTFVRLEGRDWLVERVDYIALKPRLEKLPKSQASLSPDKIRSDRAKLVRSMPARTNQKLSGGPMRVAKAKPMETDSLVLDFIIISSVPAPSGLLAWWTGGGTNLDSVGLAHATMLNGAGYAAGKVGQGFNLDGSNDRINASNSAALNFGSRADFSIEAWIKPLTNNTTYGVMTIVEKRNAPNVSQGIGYELSLVGGKVACRLSDSIANIGTGFGPAGPDMRIDGNLHHVALTVDRDSTTGGRLYVDGSVVLTFNPTVEPGDLSNNEPVRIGNHATASLNGYFKGTIDEPGIYGRVLAASEIQAIYGAGAAGKVNPNCITAPTNIVAWWPGDANVYDLARTNFAALQNGVTYVSAVVGQGFYFDGVDDGVTVPSNQALNISAKENFTIEAWINAISNNTAYGITTIVDKRLAPNISQCLGYVFCLVNGAVAFRISDSIAGIGAGYGPAGPDLRDGGYHHVAVTVNRGATNGGQMYVDGNSVLEFNPAIISGSLSNAESFRIGMHAQSGFNGYYKGIIDEVTFYRRALTNTEITALYSAGSAGKCRADTDGDGLTDLQEAFWGTNPNHPDSDNDGLTDGDEVFVYHIIPNNPDTDGDGVSDGIEIIQGRNPTVGALMDSSNQTKLKTFTPLR